MLARTSTSTKIRAVYLVAYESGPVEVEASETDVGVAQAVREMDGVAIDPGRGPMESWAEPRLDPVRLLPAEPFRDLVQIRMPPRRLDRLQEREFDISSTVHFSSRK